MASGFFLLLDDIATVLDDVAVMSKVAAKKSAGVLGDDLALNAEKVTGVSADRELPVVFAVAMGSLINKVILVPAALLISIFAPWGILPLLMAGGLYLAFEGFEKVFHKLFHTESEKGAAEKHREYLASAKNPKELAALEKDKIRGAVRTDFILSAEIIVITLGSIAGAPYTEQFLVLSVIGVVMTVGVYGLVAAIVKLDDLGLWLSGFQNSLLSLKGRFILKAAPLLMKFLGIAGTAAMFLVGGGIINHGVELLHHIKEHLEHMETYGVFLGMLTDAAAGIMAGGAVFLLVTLRKKIMKKS